MTKEYYLVTQCPDQSGLIAAVTSAIAKAGGNVLNMGQHTAVDISTFFLKALFAADEGFDPEAFKASFSALAARYSMTWELADRAKRRRVAILVSRTSHCLYEILLKHADGELECDIPVIISNHPDLASVATSFHIPFFKVDTAKGKAAYEADLQRILEEYGVDLVVMARYMQILSREFTTAWNYRVINIHHGFLPAFMGAKPYHQAWYKGVKMIGATAHFANEDLDQGPIIAQDTMRVSDTRSIDEFIRLGKDVERRVLFEALKKYLDRSVFIAGGRTFVMDR